MKNYLGKASVAFGASKRGLQVLFCGSGATHASSVDLSIGLKLEETRFKKQVMCMINRSVIEIGKYEEDSVAVVSAVVGRVCANDVLRLKVDRGAGVAPVRSRSPEKKLNGSTSGCGLPLFT